MKPQTRARSIEVLERQLIDLHTPGHKGHRYTRKGKPVDPEYEYTLLDFAKREFIAWFDAQKNKETK